ncbi:MAG: oligosaccharide flippase family protein [Candidatus Riflebacteria bacterium]|nr:oligosaccharide flippase family protein [Candidatus Riflebacteria bacterium]
MSIYKIFLKNNFSTFICQVLATFGRMSLIPLVTKTAGEATFGAYLLLGSMMSFFMGISSWGIGFTSRRFLPSTDEAKKRRDLFFPVFCFQLTSIIFHSVLFLILLPMLGKYFFQNKLSFSLWLICPYFIFYSLYTQTVEYFRSTNRFTIFNVGTVIYQFLSIFFVLSYFYFKREVTIEVLFISEMASATIISTFLGSMIIKDIGFKLDFPRLNDLWNDFKLGIPLMTSYVVEVILNSSDRYLISAIISSEHLGYYGPAFSLGSFVIFFPKMISSVLPPLMYKASDSENHEQARMLMNKSIKYLFIIVIPYIFGAMALSKPILFLLGTNEIATKGHLVTPLIAAGMLFYGLSSIISIVYLVKIKTKSMFYINLFSSLLNLLMNFVLLSIFKNILLSAFVFLFSQFSVFLVLRKMMKKEWEINYDIAVIMKSIIASLVMYCAVRFQLGNNPLQNSNWPSLIYLIFSGVFVYLILIFLMKIFSTKEITFITDFIGDGIKKLRKSNQ